ncbi:EF-hand calcium-binding domain-containing protein 12-like isoform 1-T1 [Theristicus caerulescens]
MAISGYFFNPFQRSPPESSPPRKKGGIPLVRAPYPQALVTLHDLLHKQHLRMVDVFRKAGMEGRKITRAEFIKVIQETKVPISSKDLEDVVIFLTSSTPGNFISPSDLSDCQKQWLEMRKRQSQETKRGIFRGIRCKSQATITSGLVTSWTSYAFTFLKSGMTGPTPCSAMFIRPSPPTVASKAPTAASSSASRDTWPLEGDAAFQKTNST